ncbi:alpha/beta fold hydrolase [Peribacillus sp. SCS-37]|uniref:alpha/beta fold hydrolase n=1 Tax=Paraperibacillus esterisolvens TaxID=3115296 RepID=UPI0039060323
MNDKKELGSLSYKREGKEGGEVLLFLHGFCGSAEYFKELIPYLNEEYSVITVNLRGHGGSPSAKEAFEIDDMARDLFNFISEQGLESVYMLGHSLGGYVTLAFAELFPSRLKGFSLIHSTAFPDSEEAKEVRLEGINIIEEKGIEPFIDRLVPNLFSRDSLTKLKEKVEDVKEIGYKTSPEGAKGALRAMYGRPDRNRVLRETQKPVLLVAGERDKVIPQEKVFSAEGRHIKTAVLPGAGHMGMIEAPEELAQNIKEWIKISSLK